MLTVTLLAVGGLKEQYLRAAAGEYLKRLSGFCKPVVLELDEYRLPPAPSPALVEKCIEAEGQAILAKIPKNAKMIALCIEGRQCSSEQLAQDLQRLTGETSHVVFVIGGSHGLADAVKNAAQRRLSMSAMTFPHQLARIMLLEQLYRAFSIAGGGKYHK